MDGIGRERSQSLLVWKRVNTRLCLERIFLTNHRGTEDAEKKRGERRGEGEKGGEIVRGFYLCNRQADRP